MSFFAALLALVIEQLKPLPRRHGIHRGLRAWMTWASRNFDAGRSHHAWVVWVLGVVGPAVALTGVYLLLQSVHVLLGLALDVIVLYLTLGFRQFSHHFTDIRDALDRGDDREARQLLAQWRRLDATDLSREELLRHVIEQSLLAAHRHVFGVFFWFVLLSALGLGPAGALLYRLAAFASREWAEPRVTADTGVREPLQDLARRMFERIDHVPARLTAAGFAVVGNFEEAVNSWRRDAHLWPTLNEGIILSAASGAVGVQLGARPAPASVLPEPTVDTPSESASVGLPPRMGHLQSMVGLVWRSVVLWLLLVALLSLANILG